MCLAIPGQVIELDPDGPGRLGVVDFDGTRRRVCFASIPDIEVGEYVIVHVGFALSKIDEAAAQETLTMFRDLGLLEDELGADSDVVTPAGATTSTRTDA